MSEPIRSTQRAPRTCLQCHRRKVRCNKAIPCQPCIVRGAASECRREVVRVRGRVLTSDTDGANRSYDALQQENVRLRALLASQAGRAAHGSGDPEDAETAETGGGGNRAWIPEVPSQTELAERRLFVAVGAAAVPRTVRHMADIHMPSQELSARLVQHAHQWTFWIHFSLHGPDFQQEHESFWQRYNASADLEGSAHPLWLSVYFAVLASTVMFLTDTDLTSWQRGCNQGGAEEDETRDSSADADTDTHHQPQPQPKTPTDTHNQTHLPRRKHTTSELLRNWYNASLFFLDVGDFTQRSDIRTVASLSILNILFLGMGDVGRQQQLWSLALRQAQALGMHREGHPAHAGETYAQQQIRRRLWWTLVLCEWLPVPFHPPCIHDVDFDCLEPDEVDDEELAEAGNGAISSIPLRAPLRPPPPPPSRPRPIRYHLAMIHISEIHYRLRYRLRVGCWAPADVATHVFAADEQLAELIAGLPLFLQLDEPVTAATRGRDIALPWIPWQKRSLSMTLLYYREAMARILQPHWLMRSGASSRDSEEEAAATAVTRARTRAICLSSAQALLRTTQDVPGILDPSKLRPWPHATNIFSATFTLVVEALGSGADLGAEIILGLTFLRRMQSSSIIAACGLCLLREYFGERLNQWEEALDAEA